ncbi:SRPBCC domain-containing protein [Azovibrio restrictus]|uniref:SRPBCC domain-containing protein n=1 Tax=Azovibrio restrictus TaxID=146938 RepID=UPI0026F0D3AB|nr:SRPBCC domain-containing protein [Azovibrio restrictus]
MTTTVETEIEILADPERVWAVLTGFPAYPAWNPFIPGIGGELRPGARLTVSIRPPGQAGMTFKPRVLIVDNPRELRWRGRFLVPGLLDGEHYFRIIPQGEDSVKFVHGEHFSGLLEPFLRRSLQGATRQGFLAMNAALKARAEAP